MTPEDFFFGARPSRMLTASRGFCKISRERSKPRRQAAATSFFSTSAWGRVSPIRRLLAPLVESSLERDFLELAVAGDARLDLVVHLVLSANKGLLAIGA